MRVLDLKLDGSAQNPAWVNIAGVWYLLITVFRRGYNRAPGDLYLVNPATLETHPLLRDGSENVSEPGSTWCAKTNEIVFSSDRSGRDQAYVIKPDGSGLTQIQDDRVRVLRARCRSRQERIADQDRAVRSLNVVSVCSDAIAHSVCLFGP